MNIKAMAAALLATILSGLMLSGCGLSQTEISADETAQRIGVLTHMNASELKYNELMDDLENAYRPTKAKLATQYIYFDNLNTMQMALISREIDELTTYRCVADYLSKKNSELAILPTVHLLRNNFCCALRQGDRRLISDFDQAITEMKEDGTLKELTKKYILDISGDREPPAAAMPKIPGADSVKVAVTGDLPPLDLVLADDTPAGFNTAVLAEISRRIGKNVQLINVDSTSRAAALVSKRVDVVFWVAIPKDNAILPDDMDQPEGLALTQPYYEDEIVRMGLVAK